MLSVCLCLSVRPSLLCIVTKKRHILQQRCLNKLIGSAPPPVSYTILQLSSPTPPLYSLSPKKTSHLLNHRRWCHLAITLKCTVNKRTAKISTTGIAIVSMLDGYSRQCSTIGFLSNSWVSCKMLNMLNYCSYFGFIHYFFSFYDPCGRLSWLCVTFGAKLLY